MSSSLATPKPKSYSDNLQIRKLSSMNPMDDALLRNELFDVMQPPFTSFYPSFERWFRQKLVPGFVDKKRIVLVAFKDEIAAVSAIRLAQADHVAKISSFYVRPSFQGGGVGTRLMANTCACLDAVNSGESIITVPEESLEGAEGGRFASILARFDFQKIAAVQGKYRPGKFESVFRRTTDACGSHSF